MKFKRQPKIEHTTSIKSLSGHLNKKSNIHRQILKVFVIQMLFISALTVLGVIIAAKVVEGVMMKQALKDEARHFWQLYESNPSQNLPNTDNLLGFLSNKPDLSDVPKELRRTQPGLQRHHFMGSNPLIYVEKKGNNTLFLIFDEQSVTGLSFYFGVVPLSLVLIILYISAWFAYRKSTQAVSPLVQLAKKLQQFDIEKDQINALTLHDLPKRGNNEEIEIFVQSLNAFTNKISNMVIRERNFTRDASHELRTPLTIIQGSAQWLLEQPLASKEKKNVERILRTSHDMQIIVKALLLLARGEFDVNQSQARQAIHLNQLVNTLINDLQLTHNREKHLTVDFQQKQTLQVYATKEALQIIISNLLRNAFNYALDNTIHVFIKDNALYVQNRIRQQPHEDINALFQPFVRGAENTNNHSEQQDDGHGIGLDIVKRLCDLYGWDIQAHYEKNDGIEFVLTFAAADLIEDSISTPFNGFN